MEAVILPELEHASSFLRKSSALPLQFGLRKVSALLVYLFSYLFPHTSGRQCGLKGGGTWELGFLGNANHSLCSSRPTLACLTYLFIYAFVRHTLGVASCVPGTGESVKNEVGLVCFHGAYVRVKAHGW